jgi:hypothetical protein
MGFLNLSRLRVSCAARLEKRLPMVDGLLFGVKTDEEKDDA